MVGMGKGWLSLWRSRWMMMMVVELRLRWMLGNDRVNGLCDGDATVMRR